MQDNVVNFEVLGQVARLTLNRPEAMNALNSPIVAAINAALDRIESDDELRAVIVTGTGRAFCAGADLKDAGDAQPEPGKPDFLQRAGAMMQRLRDLPKPVIAALNGLTMAGGLELAMCADIIIAADTAKIGDAHSNFGVFPGAGGAAILPRLIPEPSALYMLFTGKSLPAQRLYDLGLVSEIHPADGLADAALALATDLAARSPGSLRRMKVVAHATAEKTRAEALAHEEAMLREHMLSEDSQEGLKAFKEKRKPRFTGR
jgi:enoyl-CoA hydratase/carnithine racemase